MKNSYLPQSHLLMVNIHNLLADANPINFPIDGLEGSVQVWHLSLGIGTHETKEEQSAKIAVATMKQNAMYLRGRKMSINAKQSRS